MYFSDWYDVIGFDKFLKNSNFGGLPGCRVAGKKNFGDHVRNKNLGKVTKFGRLPLITGVDMPEPNVVPWVTLTPPV